MLSAAETRGAPLVAQIGLVGGGHAVSAVVGVQGADPHFVAGHQDVNPCRSSHESDLYKLQRRGAYRPAVPAILVALWESSLVRDEIVVQYGRAWLLTGEAAVLVNEESLVGPPPPDSVVVRLVPSGADKACLHCAGISEVVSRASRRERLCEPSNRNRASPVVVDECGVSDREAVPRWRLDTQPNRIPVPADVTGVDDASAPDNVVLGELLVDRDSPLAAVNQARGRLHADSAVAGGALQEVGGNEGSHEVVDAPWPTQLGEGRGARLDAVGASALDVALVVVDYNCVDEVEGGDRGEGDTIGVAPRELPQKVRLDKGVAGGHCRARVELHGVVPAAGRVRLDLEPVGTAVMRLVVGEPQKLHALRADTHVLGLKLRGAPH